MGRGTRSLMAAVVISAMLVLCAPVLASPGSLQSVNAQDGGGSDNGRGKGKGTSTTTSTTVPDSVPAPSTTSTTASTPSTSVAPSTTSTASAAPSTTVAPQPTTTTTTSSAPSTSSPETTITTIEAGATPGSSSTTLPPRNGAGVGLYSSGPTDPQQPLIGPPQRISNGLIFFSRIPDAVPQPVSGRRADPGRIGGVVGSWAWSEANSAVSSEGPLPFRVFEAVIRALITGGAGIAAPASASLTLVGLSLISRRRSVVRAIPSSR